MRRKRKEREEEQGEREYGTAVVAPAEMLAARFLAWQLMDGFSPQWGHWEEGGGSVIPGGILGFVLNLPTL